MTEKSFLRDFDLNYADILNRISASAEKSGRKAEDITLLAATKTVSAENINYAIQKGISYIGENRVQELLKKYDELSPSHRHFIGHLQTNKVKDIIDKVEMIESVHSLKLAKEISKQAANKNLNMDILLEVNIGGEESKSGFSPTEIKEAVKEMSALPNIKVKGLMTIPPISEDKAVLRKYFRDMYKLFVDIREEKIDNSSMDILSMGMSGDFDIAIEEGATLVRVGTLLFGKRIYN